MRLNLKILAGAGLIVNQVLEAYNSKGNKYDRDDYTEMQKLITTSDGRRNILPASLAPFIIVKDMAIKSTMKNFNEEHYKQFRKITANTTSHLFGFHISSVYTMQSYMEYDKNSDGTVNFHMRIPRPQILG
ncbi:MAG: hypothetical protein K2G83_02260 [Ruminococcus sp.]|nr:hypothetical protein [Ruminococcus sp.]